MKILRKIWLPATVGLVVVIGIVVWLVCRNGSSSEGEIVVVEEPVELLYGIEKASTISRKASSRAARPSVRFWGATG